MNDSMTPTRPYLVRAIYDWLLDNDLTPYIVVDATAYGVEVPQQYVVNGQIILNIAIGAVKNLVIGNEVLEFSARFNGQPTGVYVPIDALHAIYAKENGRGMFFGDGEAKVAPTVGSSSASNTSNTSNKRDGEKPSLTIVK